MSERFFTPGPIAAPGEFLLDGPEAHHLTTVRRAAPGRLVTLFNGDGAEYPAEVVSVGKKQAVLRVLERLETSRELTARLEVACAMPKGDRGDWLVEKLTELGAHRLTPLLTHRTVVQPKDNRIENLRHAVVEASKQCGRNALMDVTRPHAWAELLARTDLPAVRLVLHPGGRPMRSFDSGGGVVCAVGPEGGFTDEEVAEAVAKGWGCASVGPRILRIETAAVAAAAWAALGDASLGGTGVAGGTAHS